MDRELAEYCERLNRQRAEEIAAELAELHMLSTEEWEIWADLAMEDGQ